MQNTPKKKEIIFYFSTNRLTIMELSRRENILVLINRIIKNQASKERPKKMITSSINLPKNHLDHWTISVSIKKKQMSSQYVRKQKGEKKLLIMRNESHGHIPSRMEIQKQKQQPLWTDPCIAEEQDLHNLWQLIVFSIDNQLLFRELEKLLV